MMLFGRSINKVLHYFRDYDIQLRKLRGNNFSFCLLLGQEVFYVF